MSFKKLYVIGAGGHAKVVIDSLLQSGHQVICVFDDDEKTWGKKVMGRPINGPISKLLQLSYPSAVMAIGSGAMRKLLEKKLDNVNWETVIHPTAYIARDVIIGCGTVIFAKAVVQPGTTVGKHCIINTAATVDHDCKIGNYSHLAPGVNLLGGVTVGNESFIGAGAVVKQCNTIGDHVTIGAGAVVLKQIKNGLTAVGVPAKIIGLKCQ